MKFQRLSADEAEFTSCSPAETKALGASIGRCAYPGLCLLLFGGLGLGKTQLTQGIGASLGCKNVKSPTFILISEHEGRLPLIHADLYRLEARDVEPLALDDYLSDGCLLVVEWGERWTSQPDCDCWKVYFSAVKDNSEARTLRFAACGERAAAALDELCGFYGERQ